MAHYLVTYDLNNSNKNYDGLIDAIKKFPWAKICRSSWAIKSDLDCESIRDRLKATIDSDDILFVAEFDDWAAWNLSKKVVEWLNN